MKVLIGCEESGVVRRAFRGAGHDAYSNDLLPPRDGSIHHLQMDVMDAIVSVHRWDLIILHPPCTALTSTGNKHYAAGKPKHALRGESISWTVALWELATARCNHVALENPKGVIWPALGIKPVYINPWQHGHPEMKMTGFALHNLPVLQETNNVFEDMMKLSVQQRQKCFYLCDRKNRARDRSTTYEGIARAMVQQWS